MDFVEISYTSIEKSKLRSLKNVKHSQIICQYNTTLYAGDIFCNWHNLKLNGFLTFEIDYKKTYYHQKAESKKIMEADEKSRKFWGLFGSAKTFLKYSAVVGVSYCMSRWFNLAENLSLPQLF